MRSLSAAILPILLPLLSAMAKAGADGPVTPAGVIPLDKVAGHIRQMAVDTEEKRLYVLSASDGIDVIDTKRSKELGSLKYGLAFPHGIAFLPDVAELLISNVGTVNIYYGSDPQRFGTVQTHDGNCLGYDPQTKLAYVGKGGRTDGLMVFDPRKARDVGQILLAGYPEGFQLEAKGNRIFVNIPNGGHIAVIDRQKRAVVTTWPLRDSRWYYPRNYSMALDEEHHRLLVGCRRKPAKLIVIDTETGKIVSAVDCCPEVGDVFYDAQRKRVYASGDGYVSVFEQVDPDSYKKLADVTTGKSAAASLFVPEARKLYVAVPHIGPQKGELLVFDCGTDAAPATAPATESAK